MQWQRADGQRFPAAVTYSFLRFGSREYGGLSRRHHRAPPRQRPAAGERGAPEGHGGQRAGLGVSPGARRAAGAGTESPISAKPASARWATPPSACCSRGRASAAVHADDEAGYWASQQLALEKARTGAGRAHSQSRWRRALGRYPRFRARPAGWPPVWDGIVWDITENKRIELELDASRAQLRQLAAHGDGARGGEGAHRARGA